MGRQVSIRLPSRLLQELDRRARRRRRPRADIIRDALTAYLELPEGALQGRPIDRVRGLLGVIDDLPTDLATNARKHLEDLGRRR